MSGLTNVTALGAVDQGIHTCARRVTGAPHCWGANNAGQIGDGTFTTRLTPVQVPSFLANVDPDVELRRRGRVARVTVLVNCPADDRVQIRVALTQGDISGVGLDLAVCTGALEAYLVDVPVHGRGRFKPGTAQAELEAIVSEHRTVVEVHEWSRTVKLAQ